MGQGSLTKPLDMSYVYNNIFSDIFIINSK